MGHDPHLILCTKMDHRSKHKIQIVRLLEENKAENLFDLGVGRNLLEKKYVTQKEPEL